MRANGVPFIFSVAWAVTLPIAFSAEQMYVPSSSLVNLLNLSIPGLDSSVLGVNGLPSALVHSTDGVGIPAVGRH
uniref:Putative secreted protein n=1 Tax=Ixodes ricinus TaxID=34613 RepID=A0A6B0TYX3_IXORI